MGNFNVEAILAKASLRELVERAGGQPDRSGRCACPLHGGDNPNGFSIYHKDGHELWNCLSGSCGGGDAIRFVEVWQGFDFRRACAFLGGDVISDPEEMKRLAEARHAAAVEEEKAACLKVEARRKEIQVAQLHVQYHQQMKAWAREMWAQRGINECFQGLWYLGACEDKIITSGGLEYHTPTLTIPLFDQQYNVLNIKHRLINPPKPNDKYRPEREGLGAFPPFLAFPEMGYSGQLIWVIEGEIKSMVTATITPESGWQFIGVPGRNAYDQLVKDLFGKNVIVVPDPGAEKEAYKFCKSVGGRWLSLPDKIDDLILANGYESDWLRSAATQARRV